MHLQNWFKIILKGNTSNQRWLDFAKETKLLQNNKSRFEYLMKEIIILMSNVFRIRLVKWVYWEKKGLHEYMRIWEVNWVLERKARDASKGKKKLEVRRGSKVIRLVANSYLIRISNSFFNNSNLRLARHIGEVKF